MAVEAPALPGRAGTRSRVRPAVGARVLSWAALASVVGVGLFLRLYRLDGFLTFYPDSYAQLRAVENLLAGHVPVSYFYPPGVAIFLAPTFAVFPDTLATMQGVVLFAGLALIVVAHAATLRLTGDRRAALLHATAVAIASIFVYHSRASLFDVINTLTIAAAFVLAPVIARRGTAWQVAYGVLLFVTITVRFTNPVILPALFLASLLAAGMPLSARGAFDHLRSRPVLTVGLVAGALYAAYLGTAFTTLVRFGNPSAGSVFDAAGYVPRLGRYVLAALTGQDEELSVEDGLLAPAVLVLALIGGRRLWETNRQAALPIAVLVALWLPVHATYNVFQARYAMPAFFFVLLLAAYGVSVCAESLRHASRPWQRVGLVGLLALSVALFLGRNVSQDIHYLRVWAVQKGENGRETAYHELRDVLSGLDGPRSVLLSSQALAVDRANEAMVTYDLLEHSESYGINEDSIERLLAYTREQHALGKTVYYHYTEFEDVQSRFRKYELGFDAYFAALEREFAVEEIYQYPSERRTQRLYAIEPASPDP
jgi:hypothetical protein